MESTSKIQLESQHWLLCCFVKPSYSVLYCVTMNHQLYQASTFVYGLATIPAEKLAQTCTVYFCIMS